MRPPILITTPMPDPDEFAASLGISPERREFLKALAAEIKAKNRARDTRSSSKKRLTLQRDSVKRAA